MNKLFTSMMVSIIMVSTTAQVKIQLPNVVLYEPGTMNPISTQSWAKSGKATLVITYADKWCRICRSIINDLDNNFSLVGDPSKVQLFAVNVDHESDYVNDAADHQWRNIKSYHDQDWTFMKAIKTTKAPRIFFLDSKGNIIYCHESYEITASQIYQLVNLITSGQIKAGETIFYDANWFPTTKDKATYFRKVSLLPNGKFSVLNHFMNGRVQRNAEYLQLFPEMLDGPLVAYHENGKVKRQGLFKEGRREGLWIYHDDDDGMLTSKINFESDKRHGESIIYHKNGTISKIGIYQNDEIVATWFKYDDSGRKLAETNWENSKKRSSIGFYPDGSKHFKIFWSTQSEDVLSLSDPIEAYHANGNTYIKSTDVKNDLTMFYENRTLQLEVSSNSDTTFVTEYNESGTRSCLVRTYSGNESKYTEWHLNGQKSLEINYSGGYPAASYCWDEEGKLRQAYDAINGSYHNYNENGIEINEANELYSGVSDFFTLWYDAEFDASLFLTSRLSPFMEAVQKKTK